MNEVATLTIDDFVPGTIFRSKRNVVGIVDDKVVDIYKNDILLSIRSLATVASFAPRSNV